MRILQVARPPARLPITILYSLYVWEYAEACITAAFLTTCQIPAPQSVQLRKYSLQDMERVHLVPLVFVSMGVANG